MGVEIISGCEDDGVGDEDGENNEGQASHGENSETDAEGFRS
jgi:hypothetical protein